MKQLLTSGGNVRDLLTLAGSDLVERIGFDQLAVDLTQYVTADYRHLASDVVLTVPLRPRRGRRKRPLWLSILIEHQSEPDRLMVLRVLEYLVQIWKGQVRTWGQEHGSLASVKLRPILPVVFYTGSYLWENLGRLIDLMDEGDAVERHTPAYEPLFVNLPELTEDRLCDQGGYFGQVLWAYQQRRARRQVFRDLLAQITQPWRACREATGCGGWNCCRT
jgi:hypothetical protein